MESIFSLTLLSFIIAIIIGITVHEFAHAWVANLLGDPTARYQGRMSLNPIKHLDPVGTFILVFLILTTGVGFGWGKPVPINPYNLRHKHGELLVSLAGPMSNFIVAMLLPLLVALLPPSLTANWSIDFLQLIQTVVLINVMLGIFNLIPVPPLDGSKILYTLLTPKQNELKGLLERYGFIILIFVILFGFRFIVGLARYLASTILNLGDALNSLIYLVK